MDPLTKQMILKALWKPYIPLLYGFHIIHQKLKYCIQRLSFQLHSLFFWFPMKQYTRIVALGQYRRDLKEFQELRKIVDLSIPVQLANHEGVFYEIVSFIEVAPTKTEI